MKLKEYLKKHNITLKEFAEKIGVSFSTVGHYVSGRRTPSIKRAACIQEATGGEVTAKDLIPDHPAWKLVEQKEAVA